MTKAELTFIHNCLYLQFELLISAIRIAYCRYPQFELLISEIQTVDASN